jgi:alpha-ribazole phosphatase
VETKIILIRHGESLGNALKLYIGHTDVDLSEDGYEQARDAAEYFKNEKISAVYSSDLKRAYETARLNAEMRSLPVITSRELREVFVGIWEGVHVDEVTERWPIEFGVDWKIKFGTCVPPEGEPVYEAGKRMHERLLSIAKENKGTVIVASHAAAIRAFWCYLGGAAPEKWGEFAPFPSNASATFIGFDGERLIPIRYAFDDYVKNKTYVN